MILSDVKISTNIQVIYEDYVRVCFCVENNVTFKIQPIFVTFV